MFRNLGKEPWTEPWGGTNLANQVLLQLINSMFPQVWEYYWVTLFFNGQIVLEQFARHKQAIVMNQSKRAVLSSKFSEIAKSKQQLPQPSSHTNKNILKSQWSCLVLDGLLFATPPHLQWTSLLSSNFQKASKIYWMLIIHKLTYFFFPPIRKENSTSNLLKNQVLSLGRHSKKNLITCISFTLLSSLPQIRKSCEGRQSQMQSLVTCSGQKFRHLVILADLIWLPKDII